MKFPEKRDGFGVEKSDTFRNFLHAKNQRKCRYRIASATYWEGMLVGDVQLITTSAMHNELRYYEPYCS